MKTLVVYDSKYGNTEKIARAIGGAIGGDVTVMPVGQAHAAGLESFDLLIVGSPTQRAGYLPSIKDFLDGIPDNALKGVRVAAFDTRITARSGDIGTRVMAAIAGGLGYAAKPIAEALEGKGGTPAAPPEGFIVNGIHGPLKKGEPERAAEWGKRLGEGRYGV